MLNDGTAHALKVARIRNLLTRMLHWVFVATLALAAIGALDRLSWWILEELQSGNRWLWRGVGAGSFAVLVLRALVPPLQKIAAETGSRAREWLPRLLEVASMFGVLALVLAWLVLLQWFVFAPDTFDALRAVPAWMQACLLAAFWLAWIVLSAGNVQMANTCLNQTRDDRSGLFNADRKGTAVTASWRGFEVGPHEFVAWQPHQDVGTLGRWIAVSGAAASPGAGAYTSRGLALRLYFLGVRLGHWMRAPRERVQLRWLSRLAWRLIPKPMMLVSEASATYFGVERPWWYLSDAGADAHYEFADLENLVRKARIDFGAEIYFYPREEALELFPGSSQALAILSPVDMGNVHSSRGVLLARILYRERPGPLDADGRPGPTVRPQGTLLVIKPNLHDALDIDLLSYARSHSGFPHESTGDQSFDEAQWESYHRLGEDFGRALTDDRLAQLPGWHTPARHAVRVSARLAPTVDAAEPVRQDPLWRRNARAAAIGTTLGVGASGTLLLSLWQVQDQLQRNRTDQQTEARQLFAEVSKGLQAFDGTCPQLPEHVVTQAAMLLELRDSPSMRPLEQAGLERLAARITDECAQTPAASAQCMASYGRTQSSLCAIALKPRTQATALNYWHPGASPQEQQLDGLAVLKMAADRFPALAAALPSWPRPTERRAIVRGATPLTEAPAAPAPAAPAEAPRAQAPGVPQAPPAMAGAASPAPGAAQIGDADAAQSPKPTLQSCARAQGGSTLYIHIYNENTRLAATMLRQALQPETGAPLLVAPIENVVRSADLRQTRRQVSWPNPTLVLHDPASQDCARAIAAIVGAPWLTQPGVQRVRLRALPSSLPARAGVIELWLPPLEGSAGDADQLGATGSGS